jgi:hypothetical protein
MRLYKDRKTGSETLISWKNDTHDNEKIKVEQKASIGILKMSKIQHPEFSRTTYRCRIFQRLMYCYTVLIYQLLQIETLTHLQLHR